MTRIDLYASSHKLQRLHRDLTGHQERWPAPTPDSPLVRPDQLALAQTQWEDRTRATYASITRSARFFDALLAIGAPIEVLHGTSYITDELTRHLSICAHIRSHLHAPPGPLDLEIQPFLPRHHTSPDLSTLFEQGLDLFGFNLAISHSVYEALSAITSDGAIAELCRIQSESIAEIVGFGQALLIWLHESLLPRDSHRVQRKLPTLLGSYETLARGTPQLLDRLAGEEITIEARSGNLGSLKDQEYAAIYYHFLNANLFPLVAEFGWSGPDAWRRHYREEPQETALPLIAAMGLPSSPHPEEH